MFCAVLVGSDFIVESEGKSEGWRAGGLVGPTTLLPVPGFKPFVVTKLYEIPLELAFESRDA